MHAVPIAIALILGEVVIESETKKIEHNTGGAGYLLTLSID